MSILIYARRGGSVGVFCSILVAQVSQTPALHAQSASGPRAVLDQYCVTCHNERLKTAGLMLDTADVERVPQDAATWEKVVRKLRTRAMPPAGRPRPDAATYDAVATSLETELDRAAAVRPTPGHIPVHRLNRAEYANAIRDLLGLEIEPRSLLPADDAGYGFDNIADVLAVSPLLLDRYLSAAKKIARLAVGDRTVRSVVETYRAPRYLVQDQRVSEDLPFGTRGGLAVRRYFPLDGDYVVRVRLQRNYSDVIRGLSSPHRLEVRVDGERVTLFTIGGSEGRSRTEQAAYERTADEALEVRLPVRAGARVIGVDFLEDATVPELALEPRIIVTSFAFAAVTSGNADVDSIQIAGPYNATGPGDTVPRRRIFICRPGALRAQRACATKIVSALARRAYRRPTTAHDVQTLLRFYEAGRRQAGFDAGIQRALERLLVSPDFLFRVERDPANQPPGTVYRISDLELASRLSFFLWSSIPDDELLDLATRGKLREPAILEAQVRRMLADSRSMALITNFAGQWLYLRNVQVFAPNPAIFPEFDDNLRQAFQRETELFFESMLREDRGVLDLLTADYTFLNERLARHYQIPNVYGSHFRRATLSDNRRTGLLGQGSILFATSYATRTSPVLRGKWLLENLLGSPPPPPPPNVPALKDTGTDGQPATMRRRMEQHRANPVCASCHARMDPLGFALENFDGIGKWRVSDAGMPIDALGVFPDGTRFDGPVELRQVLLSRRDEFVTTVAEKLMTYALGRGVDYYDAPAIRRVVRDAAPTDHRWSSLIIGIVRSTPFQMGRSPEP